MKKNKIALVCTGLGRLNRGFEVYISGLTEKLVEEGFSDKIEVWSGGSYFSKGVKSRKIPCVFRDSWLGKRFKRDTAFTLEQITFVLALLPTLLFKSPAAIYLGEYNVYCYLFKIRKLFSLKYKLVLYTGGLAIPGLFDPQKDFVHHVTDVYLKECTHIPVERQWVLPHFCEIDIEENPVLPTLIKTHAKHKKVILSVGLLDMSVKRMDYLINNLIAFKEEVFPILLGEETKDTRQLLALLKLHFGNDGFVMKKASRKELTHWYHAADFFILCSVRESFGLAMVEALMHGLPVICNDVPEARFVLKDQGFFLKMDKENALEQELKNLLGNKQLQKSTERKTFAFNHYSWQCLRTKYIEMFDSIQS